MVRFSRSNFLSNELTLLNWTNDTGKMTSAMNQNYGNALVNGGAATAWLDGMTVYNYCFTGATHTYKGVGAFVDKMTYGMYQNYEPTATNGAPSKYLIIFTDGKDNSGNEQASKDYADNLKNNGYTIMTVFMQSAGMTDGDISHSSPTHGGTAEEAGDDAIPQNATLPGVLVGPPPGATPRAVPA